jgi:hypothetical protein
MGSGLFTCALLCHMMLMSLAVHRRETRPKILWNTGKQLETARLPEGTVAPISTSGVFTLQYLDVLTLMMQ